MPFKVEVGLLVSSALVLTGCAVGPKFTRPSVSVPTAYKELPSSTNRNWKSAQPRDAVSRGKWWEQFADPELNKLEERLVVSNYNIAAAEANVRAARAAIRAARSQYFPTLITTPGITPSRLATAFGQSIGRTFTSYSFPADISWEPDLWDRIRKTVAANSAAAEASVADLENVRLSAQAELATVYFQLRAQDATKALLDSTVAANREALDLARDQCTSGIGTEEIVAQAEANLHSSLAQDANLAVTRAQYEHAVAVLIGQPASTFSIVAADWSAHPAEIAAGLPSELLERRPDIAGAERAVAQANAQLGIASAAFFPTVVLSASGGFESLSISKWFGWPARVWSLGPSVAQTLLDGGLRRATVQQFQATYDGTVASYRQTVLAAFQEVEDCLAALSILDGVIQEQDSTIDASRRALEMAEVRYQAGLDPYANVLSARITVLAGQQTAVAFRMQQMVASVQLIKALGGGWNSQSDTREQAERRIPYGN